jgi:hypothetical protein
MVMKRYLLIPALMAVLGFCGATPAAARQAVPPPDNVRVVQDADWVRNQLHDILRSYPRSVGEILRRDPSLMARTDYMAAYPHLVAFLEQHPEIPRNVEFYFEGYGSWARRPYDPEFEALGVLLGGMAGFFLFTAVIGVFAWLVRAVIQHRRWLKASQVQADVHTKLMERMTSNEELLAYVQSPAGRRFLESAPIQPDMDSAPNISAPIGPIIWSMMAGIVLATVGVGFRLAGQYIGDDSQRAFIVVGVIIIALGLGFILASVMAYLVSSRLGLFPQRPLPESTSGHA